MDKYRTGDKICLFGRASTLIDSTDGELIHSRIFTGRVYSKVINSSSSLSSLRYKARVLTIVLEHWLDSYLKYVPVWVSYFFCSRAFQGRPSTTRQSVSGLARVQDV